MFFFLLSNKKVDRNDSARKGGDDRPYKQFQPHQQQQHQQAEVVNKEICNKYQGLEIEENNQEED